MNAKELRHKFFEFFKTKDHHEYPSSPLVPIDVLGKEDPTLLFTGAGMVQFKPYFRGVAKPPHPRLITSQKCMRTTDIDKVGNASHLTFFEMLGNFSFGDYFKKEAIEWAWEFLTDKKWLGLDPDKICVTVFEKDDEAYEIWAEVLSRAGFEPADRIHRLGEDKNCWPDNAFSCGPPGPCGPCSEIFYQTVPEKELTGDFKKDEADGKWLEIWNLVFIQYEWKGRLKDPDEPHLGYERESLEPLPKPGVDTGMGLERTAEALGQFESVYDTDVLSPVVCRIVELAGHKLACEKVREWGRKSRAQTEPIRIITEHTRAAAFCISDGIAPGRSGRPYVVRRLIRRAVLNAQEHLGFTNTVVDAVSPEHCSVLALLVPPIVDTFRGVDEGLEDMADFIAKTIAAEERLFRRTIDEGIIEFGKYLREVGINFLMPQLQKLPRKQYEKELRALNSQLFTPTGFAQLFPSGKPRPISAVPAEVAFVLWDRYGFPVELTVERAAQAGLIVDIGGFHALMEQKSDADRARQRSNAMFMLVGSKKDQITDPQASKQTQFVGYDYFEHEAAKIQRIAAEYDTEGKTTGRFWICPDITPFYAEAGGQVGDSGVMQSRFYAFRVDDTVREGDLIWHDGEFIRVDENVPVSPIAVQLASQSVTHLHLSDTWRKTDGPDTLLSGLTKEEIYKFLVAGDFLCQVTAKVDAARRRDIIRNHTATHLLHAALRKTLGKHVTQAGSLVAPDRLRFDFAHRESMKEEEVAEVEQAVNEKIAEAIAVNVLEDVPLAEARERGAMMLFGEKYADKVRMIEVPGYSLELCGGTHVHNTAEIGLFKITHETSSASGVRRIEAVTGSGAYEWVRERENLIREAAAKLKAEPTDLPRAVERLQEQVRDLKKQRQQLLSAELSGGADIEPIAVGPLHLYLQTLEAGGADAGKMAADRLIERDPSGVAVVAVKEDGKAALFCKAGKKATGKGAHAGNLIREVARRAGGGGGGSKSFAQASAGDASKLHDALNAAEGFLKRQIKGA